MQLTQVCSLCRIIMMVILLGVVKEGGARRRGGKRGKGREVMEVELIKADEKQPS